MGGYYGKPERNDDDLNKGGAREGPLRSGCGLEELVSC